MDMDQNSPEVMTAVQAVMKASSLCQKVRMDLVGGEAILKSDKSPVTIADYGSQAIICKLIRERFPHDTIVAEEDSNELRKPDRSKILEQVTSYVNAFVPISSSSIFLRRLPGLYRDGGLVNLSSSITFLMLIACPCFI